MTEALAIREKRTPEELITEGRAQANALMRVVKEANLAKDLGGSKEHLEVEAWQTIGRFNGYLTDIAWTMLFPRAAAIVTDVGAPLSHAAIVARELGIPAVVGCGDATMRLKTGDRVRVDGGQGRVEILGVREAA